MQKSDTQLDFALGRRSRLRALSVIVFGEFFFVIDIIHRLFQLLGEVFDNMPDGSMRSGRGRDVPSPVARGIHLGVP